MALEALKKISEIQNKEVPQADEQEESIPKTKWLVFYIGKKKYSVKENNVANILQDTKIHLFPFAPFFIDGVINFQNKICSVLNYEKMINSFSGDSDLNLLIILKTGSDNLAIRISKVEDFFMIPDDCYCEDTSADDDNFIQGRIVLGDEKIPVLNLSKINDTIISSCKKEAL